VSLLRVSEALAALALGGTVWLVARAAVGSRRTPRLARTEPLEPERCPSVAVVVAARDEERGLEAALRSLLAQDHPRFRVVAVDDRSTDRTGEILAALAAADSRLETRRVDALPAGWLGKNHALAAGAAGRAEELLLFTDADVVLAPAALRRACRALAERRLDHLTAGPEVEAGRPAIAVFVATFTTLFGLWLAPWRAADPECDEATGIGAFNLVRRAAYEAVGGHASIRNRPDDDLALGRRLKRGGFRQELASGRGVVRVEWYESLRAAARGLEKNVFAGLDYSVARATAAIGALVALHVLPFALAPFAPGLAGPLLAATALLQVGAALGARRETGAPAWTALFFPLGALALAVVCARSVAKTLIEGGIRWRGTFYPLDMLRRPPGDGD